MAPLFLARALPRSTNPTSAGANLCIRADTDTARAHRCWPCAEPGAFLSKVDLASISISAAKNADSTTSNLRQNPEKRECIDLNR